MGVPDHLTCLLRNPFAGQEATVRTEHRTTDCFQIEKGVLQSCICHPAYLTSMQRISWKKQAGWSATWNQDCQEKYQSPQRCRWYHPNGRKWRGTKEPLDEGEIREWKSWLKTQYSKN